MKKTLVLAVGIIAFTMATATGCGSPKAENKNAAPSLGNAGDEGAEPQNQTEESSPGTPEIPAEGSNSSPSPDLSPDNVLSISPDGGGDGSQDITIIGGKVRSTAQDSFIISRVLIDDSPDGKADIAVIPEAGSPEEELVTVRCPSSTVFEHWAIQDGGADIVKSEAAFSDIRENDGIEIFGYFDGEIFMAQKVIIEVYE